MRSKLKKIENKRKTFIGTFVRFGSKSNYHGFPEPTILLKDIKDNNNRIVCDHIWFNLTKRFQNIDLKEGDIIEFDARVKEYKKGYVNYRKGIFNQSYNYKLSYPTKIKKIREED